MSYAGTNKNPPNLNEQFSQFNLPFLIPSKDQQSTSKQNIPFEQHQLPQQKLKQKTSANKNQNMSYAGTDKNSPNLNEQFNQFMQYHQSTSKQNIYAETNKNSLKRANNLKLNDKLNVLNKNPSYHPYMRRQKDAKNNFPDKTAEKPSQIFHPQSKHGSNNAAGVNLSLLNEEARKLYNSFFLPPIIVTPKNQQLGQKHLNQNIEGNQKSPEMKTSENLQGTEAAGAFQNASTKYQSTCHLKKNLQLKKQTLQKMGEDKNRPMNLILDLSEKQSVTTDLQKDSDFARKLQNTHQQSVASKLQQNSNLRKENTQKSKKGKKSEDSTPLATGNNYQIIKNTAGLFQNDSQKSVCQDQQISQDKANNSNERRQSLSQLDMVS